MIFSIVFVIVFILGFVFGLAMPFILKKLDIYKKDIPTVEDAQKPSTNAKEIIDEWVNGKVGE